jgi:hypothetical protein
MSPSAVSSVPRGLYRRSWAPRHVLSNSSPDLLPLVKLPLPDRSPALQTAHGCPCSPKSSLRWGRQDLPLCYPLPGKCNRRYI